MDDRTCNVVDISLFFEKYFLFCTLTDFTKFDSTNPFEISYFSTFVHELIVYPPEATKFKIFVADLWNLFCAVHGKCHKMGPMSRLKIPILIPDSNTLLEPKYIYKNTRKCNLSNLSFAFHTFTRDVVYSCTLLTRVYLSQHYLPWSAIITIWIVVAKLLANFKRLQFSP